MTWQPTKQQLEDAALAGGVSGRTVLHNGLWAMRHGKKVWSPFAPTTKGKADLLDLIEAIPLNVTWLHASIGIKTVMVTDFMQKLRSYGHENEEGDKNAALARAVIEVAALVGAKMREGL